MVSKDLGEHIEFFRTDFLHDGYLLAGKTMYKEPYDDLSYVHLSISLCLEIPVMERG